MAAAEQPRPTHSAKLVALATTRPLLHPTPPSCPLSPGPPGAVIATIAVVFLPLFVPSVVDRTILVLQNLVLWLFLAALLWTFRMRQGSPYLLMDDAAAEAGACRGAGCCAVCQLPSHNRSLSSSLSTSVGWPSVAGLGLAAF